MTMLLARVWAVLLRGLSVALPIPLFVIIAAGLWLWIDTGSRVRLAVNQATAELVAGGTIKALEAQLAAERDLRQFIAGQRAEAQLLAAEAEAARRQFDEDLARTEAENEAYEKEIESLRDSRRDGVGIADDAFVDRLRNR